MDQPPTPIPPEGHSLVAKFTFALRGVSLALRSETNYRLHLAAAGFVLIAAAVLGANWFDWCILLMCIALVLIAETHNTAIEQLAKAVAEGPNDHVRRALDIAAGAVLTAAVAATLVGGFVLFRCLLLWIRS